MPGGERLSVGMSSNAAQVIERFGPALARTAAAYERNPALREELLQEIFLALVTGLPTLREPERLTAFVFRVAHNRGVTHVMKRMREPAFTELAADPPDEAANQEQAMLAGERGAALVEAIRRLKLPYRQVITLVLEDLSHEEIAEVLGLSVTNVGVRVSRAKSQLREMLGS